MSEHQKKIYERLDALHAASGPLGEEFQDLVEDLLRAHRLTDKRTWETVQAWTRRRIRKATGEAAKKEIK